MHEVCGEDVRDGDELSLGIWSRDTVGISR